MSTKQTIAYGQKYHIFEDVLDNKIYLELLQPETFKVDNFHVTVPLDREIIEGIVKAAVKNKFSFQN